MLDELRVAYRVRIPDDAISLTVRTWVNGLAGLPAEAIATAIKHHIRSEKMFPRVSEIRAKALEFLARTNAVIETRRSDDLDACAICGARYEYPMIQQEDGHFELSKRATIHHDRAKHGVAP